ncbi:MAG TPA: hypothetical protein VLZ28_08525 [Daejeonella sp.]|nr:hypothetical protein [Daejeonella sp.]
MNKFLKLISRLNLKTIYFNFKYLPFKDAIKIPVLISSRVKFKSLKGQILINAPISTALIQIGYETVHIFDHKRSRSIWEVSGTVVFEGKAYIGNGCKISVSENARLVFGNNFAMTAESSIVAQKEIRFGDDCLLSWDVLVMDTDFHKMLDEEGKLTNPPEPVIFGSKVWLGCRTLVLKGSVINDGVIVGANSTVSGKLTVEHAVYSGMPARLLKENVRWER